MQTFITSSVFKQDLKKAVDLAVELGCNIEISRFPFFHNDDEKRQVFANTHKALNNYGGEISVHGYFSDLNVASKDEEVAQLAQKRHFQTLEFAKEIGAKTVLFHTGYTPFKHNDYQKRYTKNYQNFWKNFVKHFEAANITAVLENVFEEIPQRNLAIINEINSPNLKLSIDTGHVNVYSHHSIPSWIKTYGKNLYHMHIHNNFGQFDEHNSLLNGNINFEEVFATLKEEKLSPKIIFEIFDEQALRESVEFFKEKLL